MAFALPFLPYMAMAGVQVLQGQQAAGEANYQAGVAAHNATAARQQASAREEMQRRENALRLGQQRASAAQSGFDPSTGTLVTLQGEGAAQAELEALTTRYEGGIQALNFDTQASAMRQRAKNARSSSYLSAAATLTGGALRNYGRFGPGFSGTQYPAPVETRIPSLVVR